MRDHSFSPLPAQRLQCNCSRLSDIPSTDVTESGAASRFCLGDDAPPGRHGNSDAGKLPGKPDIRVPERVERENRLGAREAERQENAIGGERGGNEQTKDRERNLNNGETLEEDEQGQIEIQGRPEGRGIHHFPGGTWLNKVQSFLKDNFWDQRRVAIGEGRGEIVKGEGGGYWGGDEERRDINKGKEETEGIEQKRKELKSENKENYKETVREHPEVETFSQKTLRGTTRAATKEKQDAGSTQEGGGSRKLASAVPEEEENAKEQDGYE
ncbi:hypothetical protein NDU88_001651 [Pleurodeles waltl]|uniref:Uncharacterized protein n=1 Tax=Pleurodeles waltl TaxID=8319 RepID=A0AAV7KTY4_PLEWA|nr:hypothetical protein NDU88_001651 [Pleurodeles waltl]